MALRQLAALKQGADAGLFSRSNLEDINYEGAAGRFDQDFDEKGDVSRGVIVEVNVQGGQLVEIGPIMWDGIHTNFRKDYCSESFIGRRRIQLVLRRGIVFWSVGTVKASER